MDPGMFGGGASVDEQWSLIGQHRRVVKQPLLTAHIILDALQMFLDLQMWGPLLTHPGHPPDAPKPN